LFLNPEQVLYRIALLILSAEVNRKTVVKKERIKEKGSRKETKINREMKARKRNKYIRSKQNIW
jgi:hypothetical protein